MKFADGSRALVESGFGLRQFAAVFGTLEGAVGQEIEYELNTSVFQDVIQHLIEWTRPVARTAATKRRKSHRTRPQEG